MKNEKQAQSAIKNEKLKVKKHALILLVVKVVKEVIAHLGELVVRVICIVDSYHNFIITTFGNVPADLRSAGIKYKDL